MWLYGSPIQPESRGGLTFTRSKTSQADHRALLVDVSRTVDGGSTVTRRVIQRIIGWALIAGCIAGAVRHVAIGGDAAWLAIWGFYAAVGAVLLWWASMQAKEQQGDFMERRYENKPPSSQVGRTGAVIARWRMRREDRRAMREARRAGRRSVFEQTDAEREMHRAARQDRKMFLPKD